ncbi:transcriptional regulator, effector-binding domain/component [Saccharomonospora marina XMU15]|uniref:Transcriptional regulator, effector-binding domain/component n=1 Tax=Saccharomonospora marina XMU15 TaxID=882083 RepID=H5X911_9PSEU|nr:GyrI-like domain-containing protein [Saccharomonospora marina]EHR53614.1 transcriptional regulator, effector-binding domain/component [Saccharomonospora marina XMU15]
MSVGMSVEPTVRDRAEQPYVGVRATITMTSFARVADRIPEIFAWLGERGIAPAGPPFFRYYLIDVERELEVEAGVPVRAAVEGGDGVRGGVLPAGRYATITHVGHPDRLFGTIEALLGWAAERRLEWDMERTERGERWGCRLEWFKTDPRVEPDRDKWETELAFRLAT